MAWLSLTPGFSQVWRGQAGASRFNGFSAADKPLKRFGHGLTFSTGLKPGVNESNRPARTVSRCSRRACPLHKKDPERTSLRPAVFSSIWWPAANGLPIDIINTFTLYYFQAGVIVASSFNKMEG
jgi:hypothetical protein